MGLEPSGKDYFQNPAVDGDVDLRSEPVYPPKSLDISGDHFHSEVFFGTQVTETKFGYMRTTDGSSGEWIR